MGWGVYVHFVRTLARPAGSIERRSVTSRTMVALFLDDKKTNDDGDGDENGKRLY